MEKQFSQVFFILFGAAKRAHIDPPSYFSFLFPLALSFLGFLVVPSAPLVWLALFVIMILFGTVFKSYLLSKQSFFNMVNSLIFFNGIKKKKGFAGAFQSSWDVFVVKAGEVIDVDLTIYRVLRSKSFEIAERKDTLIKMANLSKKDKTVSQTFNAMTFCAALDFLRVLEDNLGMEASDENSLEQLLSAGAYPPHPAFALYRLNDRVKGDFSRYISDELPKLHLYFLNRGSL